MSHSRVECELPSQKLRWHLILLQPHEYDRQFQPKAGTVGMPVLEAACSQTFQASVVLPIHERTDWFEGLKVRMSRISQAIIGQRRKGLQSLYTEGWFLEGKEVPESKELALAIEICFAGTGCYVVLNHFDISDALLEKLPSAIDQVARMIVLGDFPKDAQVVQLYYDVAIQQWRFLLMPTTRAFLNFVDRVFDLRIGQFMQLRSQADVIALLKPSQRDDLKFIVSPFREHLTRHQAPFRTSDPEQH